MKLPTLSLTAKIFIGLFLGILIGSIWPHFGVSLRPLSILFLNLIKSIIAPLIFATLVIGIAGTGDIRQVGRIGFKSLLYFEIVTTFALFIGLGAVNLDQAGRRRFAGRRAHGRRTKPSSPTAPRNWPTGVESTRRRARRQRRRARRRKPSAAADAVGEGTDARPIRRPSRRHSATSSPTSRRRRSSKRWPRATCCRSSSSPCSSRSP